MCVQYCDSVLTSEMQTVTGTRLPRAPVPSPRYFAASLAAFEAGVSAPSSFFLVEAAVATAPTLEAVVDAPEEGAGVCGKDKGRWKVIANHPHMLFSLWENRERDKKISTKRDDESIPGTIYSIGHTPAVCMPCRW